MKGHQEICEAKNEAEHKHDCGSVCVIDQPDGWRRVMIIVFLFGIAKLILLEIPLIALASANQRDS